MLHRRARPFANPPGSIYTQDETGVSDWCLASTWTIEQDEFFTEYFVQAAGFISAKVALLGVLPSLRRLANPY